MMRAKNMQGSILAIGMALGLPAGPSRAADEITPAEWLKSQPAPRFRAGHTLPPLTRFGWTLPVDARTELAERWGYALEFGGYATDEVVDRALSDPRCDEAKVLALAASDPNRYPLCIILSRDLPGPAGSPAETWTRSAAGQFLGGKERLWSPEAPEPVLAEAAELRAGPLRRLRAKARIAMILNGGEYALGVLGFVQKHWQQDPRIVAAKGGRDWFTYISQKKAAMETIIAEAVRKAAPDRTLYIYYTAGGGTHRNRTPDWQQWAYGFEWMRTASDLPSNEYYYRHFNDGWTGGNDMLTQALNARGHELKFGAKFSYDWLCAGWVDESKRPTRPATGENPAALVDPAAGRLGDLRLYAGFLKCLYTAGTLGCNGGYYAYPQGGFGRRFPADRPPHWLQQMTTLAHVHAFFTRLEPFVRQSNLLAGPSRHRWSKDQPAYEFPTGGGGVRVLARRHAGRAEWLIAAWAADGAAREVAVEIPDLGRVTVQARPEGAIYSAHLADGRPSAELLDRDGLRPTLEGR